MTSHARPDFVATPLARKLAERIATAGPISYHDYIDACLYDTEHGYYRKRDPLGRGGDFITAPEISQVFGELIGLWAGEVWRQMGELVPVRLIELGPGRGTLMADALRALRVQPRFQKSATVHLIETSEPLRSAQRAMLADAHCAIYWHETIEAVPHGPSIVIANEFLDCLPVRQFVFDETAKQWQERVVMVENGGFKLGLAPDGHEVPPHPANSGDIGDGTILELRPSTSAVIRSFAGRAEKAPFAALVIDYGYSRPSFGDTVQAVKGHHFCGPFEAPGEADITAHVDFTHLKQEAALSNFSVFGPMAMGEWLLRLGLETRLRQLLANLPDTKTKDLQHRISRLVDPAQMGALFKVLALTNGVSGPPPPFP